MADDIDIETELNHTELVALAKFNDLQGASKAATREALINAILTLTDDFPKNPIDKKRDVMSKWLKRWWNIFKSQPEQPECPNCYECSDVRALDCFDLNEGQME